MTDRYENLLRTAEVAERYGVPAATLRWWRYTDHGPRCFKIGKHTVYRQADIEAWLAEQEQLTGVGGDST